MKGSFANGHVIGRWFAAGVLSFAIAILSPAGELPALAGTKSTSSSWLSLRHEPNGSVPLLVAEAPKPKSADRPAPQPPEDLPPTPDASAVPPPLQVETERPKSEKPIDQLLLQRGAILLPKGTLQIEPMLDYTRLSSDRVALNGYTIFEAIVVGTIKVDKVNRDIFTQALNARYGLLNRLQLETRIPYVYRRDRELLAAGTAQEIERTTESWTLGDIEGSLVYQALIGSDSMPDILLRLRGRSRTGKDAFEIPTVRLENDNQPRLAETPTGNGYYSVAPGFTMVWRSDPVVFFGGFNYSLNRSRTVAGVGKVDAGDNWEAYVGLNMALNERVSVNMSFFDSQFNATSINGRDSPGTAFNSGVLSLGASLFLSPTNVMLVTAGIGVTKESPDFQFTLSFPTLFKLF